MPIDASIALQGKLPQIGNPLDAYGKFQSILQAQQQGDNAAQQNKLAQLIYGEKQREVSENALLNDAYRGATGPDGTIDRNKLFTTLAGSGIGSKLPGIQKTLTEADRAGVDLQGARVTNDTRALELRIKKADQAIKDIAAFTSPQEAAADIQRNVQLGNIDPATAQRILQTLPQDPAQFPQWQQKMLLSITDAKTRLEMTAPKFDYKDTGQQIVPVQTNAMAPGFTPPVPLQRQATPGEVLTDDRTRSEGDKNRGVQVRGQNMVDARARETNATALSKPFEVTAPDGEKILVRQDKQGNITRVEGFMPKTGNEKPLTESQAKAVAFSSRMQNSDKIIRELEEGGKSFSTPGSRAGYGIGASVNVLDSKAGQSLNQAKRDFINANLRRESGAVISDAEFDNAEKQYFPQIGDSKEVRAQKANNRRIALEGMKADIPKAAQGKVDAIVGGNAQDAAALNWANANPNDPRAAQIKARLGVK